MKFIHPKAELISDSNPYQKIEDAARTCYKSEANRGEGTAERMTRGLIKSQHTAMVEHAVFCFELKPIGPVYEASKEIENFVDYLSMQPFFRITGNCATDPKTEMNYARFLVSANARAISELDSNDPIFRAVQEAYPILAYGDGLKTDLKMYKRVKADIVNIDDLPDLSLDEIGAHKVLTFRFTTDRGVTHELVRHRPCSFAQESTRYVNYREGLNIALPDGFYEKPEEVQKVYEDAFWNDEENYRKLIELGEKPQQARAILPNAIKTEIVVTAHMEEWEHMFNLRVHGTTGAPHPDIKAVMQQALDIAMKDPIAARYLEA